MSRRRPFAIALAGALLLVPVAAHAQAPAPSPADVKTATTAFQAGTKLFGAKKFALALVEFQKSYDTVKSPNSLLYIARCQNETGAHKEAYLTFRRVIQEAEERGQAEPKYLPTRDSAKVEMEEVANTFALLTVNVANAKDATRLKVGGAPVDRADWGKPLPHDPGALAVSLETDGLETVAENVELAKGDKKVIELAVKEPSLTQEPRGPEEPTTGSGGPSGLFIAGLVAAGAGVAGMVTFGVAGGMTLSTFGELEDTCGAQPGGRCTSAADLEVVDRGQTERPIANVGLIVGAVGLAAGATLIVIDLATSGGSGSDGSTKVEASAKLDLGPGYVGVSGAF